MKFSIVITTHNRQKLLRRAIESALAQTIHCSVIVVDDCSSDGTQAYLEEKCKTLVSTGDHRLIYHRNSTNLGHSASVNIGVKLAEGNWIKLLDDDDYLAANCLEEMRKAIMVHPQAVICSCQAVSIDARGIEIGKTRKIGLGRALYVLQENIHYGMLFELLPFGTPIQVAFSRDAFFQSGGWDSQFDTNFDDIDSWIRIAQFGDAIFINKCLAFRTVWSGAHNRKFPLHKRCQTHLLVKKKIYSLVSEKHRHALPKLTDIYSYIQLHWILVALKQGKPLEASKISLGSILSLAAWQILLHRYIKKSYLKDSYSNSSLNENILPNRKSRSLVNKMSRVDLFIVQKLVLIEE